MKNQREKVNMQICSFFILFFETYKSAAYSTQYNSFSESFLIFFLICMWTLQDSKIVRYSALIEFIIK